MISKRDMLAKLIFSLMDASPEDQLSRLQQAAANRCFPKFEVRTVGPNGSLQIKVPHQEWIKPAEWAINHRNTIERKMKEDLERVIRLGVKPSLKFAGYMAPEEFREPDSSKFLAKVGDVDLSSAGYFTSEQISQDLGGRMNQLFSKVGTGIISKAQVNSVLNEYLLAIKRKDN